MSMFVEVPPEEIVTGGAIDYESNSKEGEDNLLPLIEIHGGPRAPKDAFVTVRYHDMSFWIDGNDRNSKLSLGYLTLMLTVAETGDIKGPQLTISTN